MMNRSNYRLLFVAAAFTFQAIQALYAQTKPTIQALKSESKHQVTESDLKLDPSVRKGRLNNGFTYYIRQNKTKVGSADFTLVNKVGSVNEKEHERGLAHFVEHMAFNGTRNFPGNGIIDYLQQQGVRFGNDLNAYTGFEETVYLFPLSTNKKEVIERGLQVMRDWAGDISFDQTELDAERGVILEEKRATNSLGKRVMEKILPISTNNSIFGSRLPIGTEEVLKSFTRKDIVNFYETWYRPDRQAIIVVGDIQVDEIEAMIKEKFADLKIKNSNPVVERGPIVLAGQKQFLVVTDPENINENVQINIKNKSYVLNSVANYRYAAMESLWLNMLRNRFMNIASNTSTAPYKNIIMYYGDAMGDLKATTLSLFPKEGMLRESVIDGWKEFLRLKKFAFSPEEYKIAEEQIKATYERMVADGDKSLSSSYTDKYKLDFLKGRVAMSTRDEQQLCIQVLQSISLQDIQAKMTEWLKDEDWDVILTANEKDKNTLPGKSQFFSWLDEATKEQLTPYQNEKEVSTLMDATNLKGGEIITRKELPEYGVTELLLGNGATVVLKPTSFKHNEILIRAASLGGLSLLSENDFKAGKYVGSFYGNAGVNGISVPILGRMQQNNKFAMRPYLQDLEEGLDGGSGRASLEQALQLMYLRFTKPELDKISYEKSMELIRTTVQDQYKSPNKVFSDTLSTVLTNNNVRHQPILLADLDKFDLDRIESIYKERFKDAADFTFFIVGNFEVDSIQGLITKYIGSLPSQNKKETYVPPAIDWHKGAIQKKVYAGLEDKATVVLYFGDTFQNNPLEKLRLRALESALKAKMLSRLRERESGVYSPAVSMSLATLPKERFTMNISFVCSPENVDHLIQAAKEEIATLQQEPIAQESLDKFKKERLVLLNDADKNNSFWMEALRAKYLHGIPVLDVAEEKQLIDRLTVELVQHAAKTYLPLHETKEFVLLPTTQQ